MQAKYKEQKNKEEFCQCRKGAKKYFFLVLPRRALGTVGRWYSIRPACEFGGEGTGRE